MLIKNWEIRNCVEKNIKLICWYFSCYRNQKCRKTLHRRKTIKSSYCCSTIPTSYSRQISASISFCTASADKISANHCVCSFACGLSVARTNIRRLQVNVFKYVFYYVHLQIHSTADLHNETTYNLRIQLKVLYLVVLVTILQDFLARYRSPMIAPIFFR